MIAVMMVAGATSGRASEEKQLPRTQHDHFAVLCKVSRFY